MHAPPAFTLLEPKKGKVDFVPLVVDSPHSGIILPEDFDFICSLSDLRQSDEFYVERFGESATRHGGTFLKATVSRAYIDLNRAISDLHPDICEEPIPWPISRSKRVMYGIGLIRHLIRLHEPVYAAPLKLADIQRRIDHYYKPYYEALENALTTAQQYAGRVLHINLHAMPNIGIDGSPLPDIVIGDHDGHSSARMYRDKVKKYFESCGLKVVVNNPYKGAELTRRFAKPRQGIHSLQIEVNKALYMDETTFALNEGMPQLVDIFDGLWTELAAMLQTAAVPKAAE
jgi:N-formylglutamate deformylase